MRPRRDSSVLSTATATIPNARGPVLDFERTAELIERMRDPMRRQVGAMEVVTGTIDEDDMTTRLSISVDLLTGSGIITSWVVA